MIAGITESKSKLGHDVAKQALNVLNTFYPRFIWHVRADGGCLIVKCHALGNACMIRHLKDIHHDAGAFTKEVIRAAGEFLERGYLKRGKWEGDYAEKLDGAEAFPWKPSLELVYEQMRTQH